MWPNLQFPANLVSFTEEILNGKFHFLCSVYISIFDEHMPVLKVIPPVAYKKIFFYNHSI